MLSFIMGILFSFQSQAQVSWKCSASGDATALPLNPTSLGFQLQFPDPQNVFDLKFNKKNFEFIFKNTSRTGGNSLSHVLNCEADGINCTGMLYSSFRGKSTTRPLSSAVTTGSTVIKDDGKEILKYRKSASELQITYIKHDIFKELNFRCNK